MLKQLAPTGISNNHRGAFYMMVAMVGYVCNDTATKLISAEMSIFQLIFVRGIILSCIIGIAVRQQGETLNPFVSRDPMLWLRVVCEIFLSFFFLTALFNMPLANLTAIMQATPLAITLAVALFFGERVGWKRYTSIAIGFVGVLIIVRPGTAGFNVYSLLGLLAVITLVIRDLATQHAKTQTSSISMVYVTAVIAAIVNGVIVMFTEWEPLTLRGISGITASALSVFVGYFFSVLAMRIGEASYTAPFRYTVLVLAILISIFVFGDIPDQWTLIGSAIVAIAGLYTLHVERSEPSRSKH